MLARLAILSIMILLFASFSSAAEYHAFSRINDIPGYTDEMRKLAEDNFTRAKGQDGKNQSSVTIEEKKSGIIPLEDVKRVTDRAVFTTHAQWCGFEWEKRSFMVFMNGERAKNTWNDRQLAYIGLLHGVSMGYMERIIRERGKECLETDRKKVENYFKYLEESK